MNTIENRRESSLQETDTRVAVQSNSRLYTQTSTFVNNMQLPIHRWFRFPAGFSAAWATEVIRHFRTSDSFMIFDPFAGCGTTVLAGEECCTKAIGIDAHPFLSRIAKTKLQWRSNINAFEKFGMQMLGEAQNLPNSSMSYPRLILKCYSEDILQELDKLRRAWINSNDNSPASELAWLALICILRPTSHVGTAPWTYVLPRKRKKKVTKPFEAFINQIRIMVNDIRYYQDSFSHCPIGSFYLDDARNCSNLADNSVDLVITSPPYANNYDYADAMRLEMSFLGDINRWSDLHTKVRRHLVRSCSQHMSNKDDLSAMLNNKNLDTIIDELEIVCRTLQEAREHHGGRKRYDLMIAAYFSDLAKVWTALRRVCKPGATVCFVVGDSAPYSVYVPVDKWLGELAIASGFRSYRFEKIRDRNVKWNVKKKHKIPLHEGRLWVQG